ncbi:MAG: glycosyltransferase family 2 protein [Opitutus sp.]
MTTVSVVIVNWHSTRFVRECLKSLLAHAKTCQLQIIVVDNATYDGCEEMLAAEFPAALFIQTGSNLGFARANNIGADHATGEFILLLNPDTLFIEDSLAAMLNELVARPHAGALGCRLLNGDRTLQTSCVQAFPTILNQTFVSEALMRRFPNWPLWGISALYADPQRVSEVEVISGACILLPREAFRLVQGFTVSYFMYSEDLDLCYKLRKIGRPVYYTPHTSLVHFGGGSSRQAASDFSTVMMQSSVSRFMKLNYGGAYAVAHRIVTFFVALLRLIFIAPLLVFGTKVVRHGLSSFGKWFAILRWSIGLVPVRPVKIAAATEPILTGHTAHPSQS